MKLRSDEYLSSYFTIFYSPQQGFSFSFVKFVWCCWCWWCFMILYAFLHALLSLNSSELGLSLNPITWEFSMSLSTKTSKYRPYFVVLHNFFTTSNRQVLWVRNLLSWVRFLLDFCRIRLDIEISKKTLTMLHHNSSSCTSKIIIFTWILSLRVRFLWYCSQ